MNKVCVFLVIVFLSACGAGSSDFESVNSAPWISGSISTIRVGETLNWTPEVRDDDNDPLMLSIEGQPSWMSFDSQTGNISGVPAHSDLDSVSSITITVSDREDSNSIVFDLTVIKPIFFIGFHVSNLDKFREVAIEVNSCFTIYNNQDCSISNEIVVVVESGIVNLPIGIWGGSSFEVKIHRDAGRQDCTLEFEEGIINYSDKIIRVDCQPDISNALFSLDKMHKIRLIMDQNEWHRFVLDTQRSNYCVGDATGEIRSAGYCRTHSEVYRQVDFEYLNANGDIVNRLEKVGFKMRGNTSRQWPESSDSSGYVKPSRFGFSLKFDEEFDEDESVYSCINAAGMPAAVDGHPCENRVGKDLDEVPENDDREFMGVEKLMFRFNRDDPSYQRELLAHDIINNIGIPASRVAHANIELEIVGNANLFGRPLPQTYNMGVFQMVEQIDKTFLKRFFGKNGFLFKIGDMADLAGSETVDSSCVAYEDSSDFVNPNFCNVGVEKSDPDSREEWLGLSNYLNPEFVNSDINAGGEVSQFRPYKPTYDLKTKKKSITEGRELLRQFVQFVQTNPSVTTLEEHFDVAGFIKAQAAEIVMGAVDHYVRVGNNYYLYLNGTTSRWTYFINDLDFVFRDSHSLKNGKPDYWAGFRDIMETYAFPSSGKIDWAQHAQVYSLNPILWNIVFSEQTNKHQLYTEIREILEQQMNWDVVGEKLALRNSLVASAIQTTDAVSPKGCEYIYNPEAIDAAPEAELCDASDVSILEFINGRSAALYQELNENGY